MPFIRRRAVLAAALLSTRAFAQDKAAIRRLGMFSMLGTSVRIVARDPQEVRFRELGMDELVFDVVGRALQAGLPGAELRHFRPPTQVSVDDQLAIGTAAARRTELPAWVVDAARESSLSHVLLIGCHGGTMELRTGTTEVLPTERATGIGFLVSAAGRIKNTTTGTVTTGFLGPFVQLRLTLIDMAGPKLIHTALVNDGYVVGSTQAEAPDPWQFLTLEQKGEALRDLLRQTLARGTEQVLAAR